MSVSYSLTPSYSCSVNRNATKGETPSQKIDSRISEYADWRGEQLGRMRNLILASHADIFEEWKWNVPVWSCHGIICTGEVYKSVVKLTFAKGASLHETLTTIALIAESESNSWRCSVMLIDPEQLLGSMENHSMHDMVATTEVGVSEPMAMAA